MFKFFISLILVFTGVLYGQKTMTNPLIEKQKKKKQEERKEKRKDAWKWRYPGVSLDIGTLAMGYIFDEGTKLEGKIFVIPWKTLFLKLEGGYWDYHFNGDDIMFSGKGTFFAPGFEIGVLSNKKNVDAKDDFFLIGAHYGIASATQSHSLIQVTSLNRNYAALTSPAEDYSFHWITLSGGIRAKIVPRIFLGWSFNWNIQIYKNYTILPYKVPGYGNPIYGSTFSVSYRVSLIL